MMILAGVPASIGGGSECDVASATSSGGGGDGEQKQRGELITNVQSSIETRSAKSDVILVPEESGGENVKKVAEVRTSRLSYLRAGAAVVSSHVIECSCAYLQLGRFHHHAQPANGPITARERCVQLPCSGRCMIDFQAEQSLRDLLMESRAGEGGTRPLTTGATAREELLGCERVEAAVSVGKSQRDDEWRRKQIQARLQTIETKQVFLWCVKCCDPFNPQMLIKRGERLQSLQQKTTAMSAQADSFLNNCKKLSSQSSKF